MTKTGINQTIHCRPVNGTEVKTHSPAGFSQNLKLKIPASEIKKDKMELNISTFPSGIYFLRIKKEKSESMIRIIKQ